MDLQALLTQYGIPMVALYVLLNEIGVPTGIPLELTLLVTGAFAIGSWTDLVWVVLLLSLADMVGTTILHLLARSGSAFLQRFTHPEGRAQRLLLRLQSVLGGREVALVFVGRLVPLARMWVTIGTGVTHLRFRRFLLGAYPASVLFVSVPLTAGFVFRASISRLVDQYGHVSGLLIFALPLVALIAGGYLWTRRAKTPTHQLHRGRALLAFLVGSVAGLVVLVTASRQDWLPSLSPGHLAATVAPAPEWGLLLASLALLLWVFAAADLWTSRFTPFLQGQTGKLVLWEATATLSAMALIGITASLLVLAL
jgi:membrane protein DedA with SNARE-associated domain